MDKLDNWHGFSNRALEKQFRSYYARRQAAHDAHTCQLVVCIWLIGSAWLSFRVRKLVLDGVGAALIWALPGLFQMLAPEAYIEHRRICLVALRLLCLKGPSLARWLDSYTPETGPTFGSLLCVFTLGTAVGHAWLVTMGLRLSLADDLPLLLLLAWRSIFFHIVEVCQTAYMQSPAMHAALFQASSYFALYSWFVVPFQDTKLITSAPDISYAYALMVTVQVIFGLFLPAAAIYVSDRKCRAEFLEAAAATSRLPLRETMAASARRLGLPPSEVLAVVMFDPLETWVGALSFLPPLAAVIWLGALTATAKWAVF